MVSQTSLIFIAVSVFNESMVHGWRKACLFALSKAAARDYSWRQCDDSSSAVCLFCRSRLGLWIQTRDVLSRVMATQAIH